MFFLFSLVSRCMRDGHVDAVLLVKLFLFNITNLFFSVSLISCYSGEGEVGAVLIRTTAAVCLNVMLFFQVTIKSAAVATTVSIPLGCCLRDVCMRWVLSNQGERSHCLFRFW